MRTLIRRTVNVLLAGLWVLLAAVYTAPFWLPRFVSVDYAFVVEPTPPEWLLPVILAGVYLLPLSVLAAVTWWWFRRRRELASEPRSTGL